MDWTRMPNSFGYWFFTLKGDDWDLAVPVAISCLGSNEAEYRYIVNGPVHPFLCNILERDMEITPALGFWFGPVVVTRPKGLTPPNAQLREMAAKNPPPATWFQEEE